MEDNLSIKSTDSVTTSGEYEIVPELIDSSNANSPDGVKRKDKKPAANSPTLNIGNNGDIQDMENNLNEVIHELDATTLAQNEINDTGKLNIFNIGS